MSKKKRRSISLSKKNNLNRRYKGKKKIGKEGISIEENILSIISMQMMMDGKINV